MTETWKPVVGYEGLYEVSDLGRVRRVGSDSTLATNCAGYQQVSLYGPNGAAKKTVHRMVLDAFIGRPDGIAEVRHLNGWKDDNRLENLAWGSHTENNRDKRRHGTNGQKLTEADVASIRSMMARGLVRGQARKIAKMYGVSTRTVYSIKNNQYWKAP